MVPSQGHTGVHFGTNLGPVTRKLWSVEVVLRHKKVFFDLLTTLDHTKPNLSLIFLVSKPVGTFKDPKLRIWSKIDQFSQKCASLSQIV